VFQNQVGVGSDFQNPYGDEMDMKNISQEETKLGVGDEGSGYIGEFSMDYIIAETFKLFDVDGSGKITASDLA